MTVPFLDLHRQHRQIAKELKQPMQAVMDQCAFSGGAFTSAFEADFATFCRVKRALGVNSGTSALHMAMRVLGIGPGDEVILPANTFIASTWAPVYLGATPVFVDCNEYYNIDIEEVERAITTRTKAIIGVHLYGQPCDVGTLQMMAADHQIHLIEDAAQAHGARYNNQSVGGLADIGCFSFYPSKNLGAVGEGGAVTTNHLPVYQHMKRLRNHGTSQRYHHDEVGYNMRMDGLQAAILQVKLRHLDEWNRRRRAIAQIYDEEITHPQINKPLTAEFSDPVYHLYVIKVARRAAFTAHLSRHHVGYGLHYPIPCHLQKAFSSLGHGVGAFPKTEELAAQCVSLPLFPEMTDSEIGHVVETVNAF